MLRSSVISGVILRVKSDAEFKNDVCKTISQRVGAVLVNLYVNGVVFRKIFVFWAFETDIRTNVSHRLGTALVSGGLGNVLVT